MTYILVNIHIYVYYILRITDWKHKKMGLNSIFWHCWNEGKKKNWYMCMYFIIKFSKLRASQKKVVPETILKFLKNIVASNLQ